MICIFVSSYKSIAAKPDSSTLPSKLDDSLEVGTALRPTDPVTNLSEPQTTAPSTLEKMALDIMNEDKRASTVERLFKEKMFLQDRLKEPNENQANGVDVVDENDNM